MNGNALLIVPSAQRETDAWMVPDPGAIAASYNEAQFAPSFAELTRMMRRLHAGRHLQFQLAARQLQDNLRALIRRLSARKATAARVFRHHSKDFTRSESWWYGDRPRNFNCGTSAQTWRGALQTLGVGIALLGLALSGKRNCNALPDCWPATGHEHV